MTRKEVAKRIDLAVLKPDATRDAVLEGCHQAKEWRVKSLFVLPCWLEIVVAELRGSGVLPGTVIAFPFGAETTGGKAAIAEWAVSVGAMELDMVMSIGRFKSGDEAYVRNDIRAVVEAAKGIDPQVIVKVILETGFLTAEEKRCAARLVEEAGADFVKTSTGFGPKGATIEDVKLLRASVSDRVGVKAAGGIRTWAQAKALLEAGATRLGTSSATPILREAPEE